MNKLSVVEKNLKSKIQANKGIHSDGNIEITDGIMKVMNTKSDEVTQFSTESIHIEKGENSSLKKYDLNFVKIYDACTIRRHL